ncbi:MAG: NAD-dependent protein deacylase [Bacilli bacterium]|nr:NAD-dependent protein deacylase [Bacilli bacterium]
MKNDILKLISYIKESKKTVFFGGAGVSTESGLKDFRSKDGLYNEKYDYPPEEILSHTFFMNKPDEFYKFYKDKLNSTKYKPNITHKVLKKLEDHNLLSSIITQNIDGFDIEAGSKRVIELHGSIKRNYCTKCHKFYDEKYIFNSKDIPRCTDDNAIIKPDVVLYEEPLNDEAITRAIKEISTADLLIIGGTSLNVYPAAGLINYFRGKHIVLINKQITPYNHICDIVINTSIGEVFKEIEKELHL